MADHMDSIPSYQTPKERQLAAVPELQNHQPHQPSKEGHAEDHPKQTSATSRRDHCRRASRFQSRKEPHGTNIQSQDPLRETPAASAESLPCFIDFKKAFDRVWHEALWVTMRKYINASIIPIIENLYDKAQSAVLFNGSTGEWFRTTVGARQGCLLSPTLFNIFLERIMCEAGMTRKVVSASRDDSLPTSALQMTLS